MRLLHEAERDPGLTISELMRRSELGAGTAYYHIFRLESRGILRTMVVGRRRLVFPAHVAERDAQVARSLALLAGPTASAVAKAIVDAPGTSVEAVASITGESIRAAYYHVKRLRDAGLVRAIPPRACRGLVASELLVEVLALQGSVEPGLGVADRSP